MADSKGLTGTPFEKPACPTPGMDGDGVASRGGFNMGEGSASETANSLSGLPTLPTTVSIADAPAAGANVAVDGAVASPQSPQANILKK